MVADDEKLQRLRADYSAALANLAVRQYEERLEEFLGTVPSHIERLVGAALLYVAGSYPLQDSEARGEFLDGEHLQFEEVVKETVNTEFGLYVWYQMNVGKYRADFVIQLVTDMGQTIWGVLECDGHDYHERTKEQAEHDKTRDRYFQSIGLLVLRYTGREIWRDPFAVAVGACQILSKRAQGGI
jgi:very-short-patch-repair endonuclease